MRPSETLKALQAYIDRYPAFYVVLAQGNDCYGDFGRMDIADRKSILQFSAGKPVLIIADPYKQVKNENNT